MSNDTLERLAAVNPANPPDAPDGAPALERILATDRYLGKPHQGVVFQGILRRPLRIAVPAVILAAVILAVVALSGGGNPGPSLVARAEAATSTKGVILAYRITLTQTIASEGANISSTSQVWESASAIHRVQALISGQGSRTYITRSEAVATLNQLEFFMASPVPGTIEIGPLITHGCHLNLFSVLLGDASPECGSPITALHTLLTQGHLRPDGTQRLAGATVDVLTGGGPSGLPNQTEHVTVLIDPRTGAPLEVRETDIYTDNGPGPKPPRIEGIARFSAFRRLPDTTQNQRLLQMDRHPGAKVVRSRLAPPSRR